MSSATRHHGPHLATLELVLLMATLSASLTTISEIGSYLDGRQGYRMADTDGLMTLTLDAIDPSGLTAVVSYYLCNQPMYGGLDSMKINS